MSQLIDFLIRLIGSAIPNPPPKEPVKEVLNMVWGWLC